MIIENKSKQVIKHPESSFNSKKKRIKDINRDCCTLSSRGVDWKPQLVRWFASVLHEQTTVAHISSPRRPLPLSSPSPLPTKRSSAVGSPLSKRRQIQSKESEGEMEIERANLTSRMVESCRVSSSIRPNWAVHNFRTSSCQFRCSVAEEEKKKREYRKTLFLNTVYVYSEWGIFFSKCTRQ